MKTLMFLASLAICSAQTAVVVKVSDSDAQEARAAYAKLKQAQKEWDSTRQRLEDRYRYTEKSDHSEQGTKSSSDGSRVLFKGVFYREGFECGINFSADFSFAVPAECTKPTNTWGNGWGTITPAGTFSLPALGHVSEGGLGGGGGSGTVQPFSGSGYYNESHSTIPQEGKTLECGTGGGCISIPLSKYKRVAESGGTVVYSPK